jgi:hypothetical protein
MAFTTEYAFNVKYDGTLVPEKRWVVDVFYRPSTSAATPTAPGVTTGPLGASGTATANRKHNDGTAAGHVDPLTAIQHAVNFLEGNRAIGNGN